MTTGGVTVLADGTIVAPASWWTANNIVLGAGQTGEEADTRKTKVGDGATAVHSMTYNSEPGTSTLNASQTTLNGTTAGTAVWSQPFIGSAYKKFLVYLGGYENTTGSAQTITFPTAFTHAPRIVVDDSSGASVSTTVLTLPASMGSTKTGWIILEGY